MFFIVGVEESRDLFFVGVGFGVDGDGFGSVKAILSSGVFDSLFDESVSVAEEAAVVVFVFSLGDADDGKRPGRAVIEGDFVGFAEGVF